MLSTLRQHPTGATWTITILMALVSGILLIPLLGYEVPLGAPFEMSWWQLALIFAVVELGGIHISTRRGAHTLTLAELPLVLGMAISTPLALASARLVGLLGTLSWVRWQNALKLAFNVSNALLGTGLALTTMLAVTGGESVTDPRGWLGLGAGVIADGLVSGVLVAVVIAINDPQRRVNEVLAGLTVSWLMSLATAVVSILVFIALASSLWAGVLGAMVVFGLVFAVKIYGRLHGRHQEITALLGLTKAIEGPLSTMEIVERTLRESGRLLRVNSAEFLYKDGADHWTRASLRSSTVIEVHETPGAVAERVIAALGHHVLELEGSVPQPVAEWQQLAGIEQGVVSPLVSRDATVGAMMIGNRPAPLDRFSQEDLGLIASFSGHVAAKIDQAVTEDWLRREIDEKHRIIKSKDQLIAAVSHELRTPLTGILGFAETLREQGDALDPELTAEAIAAISSESTDLANIVDDLLTAARFELGALRAHTSATDLVELTGRVIETMSARVDHPIEADLQPAVADVDPPRTRQILRNLITNAGRYGGDRIVVTTVDRNGIATVEVRDNGTGIGDIDPETIFAPYGSAHDPGTQPGSVGLGLTVSRHLARLMGGDLTFRREEPWSVFTLTFNGGQVRTGEGA